MTVIHNGVRYHDEDAKALGITAKAEDRSANKAQAAPDNDKAAKPSRARGKKAD